VNLSCLTPAIIIALYNRWSGQRKDDKVIPRGEVVEEEEEEEESEKRGRKEEQEDMEYQTRTRRSGMSRRRRMLNLDLLLCGKNSMICHLHSATQKPLAMEKKVRVCERPSSEQVRQTDDGYQG